MEVDTKLGIIYCWRNIHNGKRYIGQTTRPKKRYNEHKRHLGNYDGQNLFGRALNKYSLMSDWEYTIIEEVPTSQLDTREIYWIAFYNSNDPEHGYNMATGGDRHDGFELTEEARKKISESLRGKKFSLEHRKKLSKSHSLNRVAVYQNDTLISICNNTLEAGLIAGVSYYVVIRIASGRYRQTKSGYSFKYISKSA